MKKFLFILTFVPLLAGSCNEAEKSGTSSLKTEVPQLIFEAKDAARQTIHIEAVNVEWDYTLSATGELWLKVIKEGGDNLSVEVTDNISARQRTNSIIIKPLHNDEIEPLTIPVIQKPLTYSLTIDQASLTFEPEEAPARKISVTAEGEGLTWSTIVDRDSREWITVTDKKEGAFTVSVADNTGLEERTGNITVLPSNEAAPSKMVKVLQQAKPTMSIALREGATLQEGLIFEYDANRHMSYYIDVTANVKWKARPEYDSGDKGWMNVPDYLTDLGVVSVSVLGPNTSPEPRTGRVVFASEVEGVGPLEVKVTQKGMPEYISTVTHDIDLGTVANGRAVVYTNNADRQEPYSLWQLELWSAGVNVIYGSTTAFTGTGFRIAVLLASDPLTSNGANPPYLPDGEYRVVTDFGTDESMRHPYTISNGTLGESHPYSLEGAWYVNLQDNMYTDAACIAAGTMTVSRTGRDYNINFDFISDAGYDVTGSFQGILETYAR